MIPMNVETISDLHNSDTDADNVPLSLKFESIDSEGRWECATSVGSERSELPNAAIYDKQTPTLIASLLTLIITSHSSHLLAGKFTLEALSSALASSL